MKTLPVHHGISEVALFVLVRSQGNAILSGCTVQVLNAKRAKDKPTGWYNVQVRDVVNDEVFWIQVTTEEHKQAQSRAYYREKVEQKKKRQTW